MIVREEIIGDCRLILGDCREVLPTLGKVDSVVTDPPYGVNIGKHKALSDNRSHLLRKNGYANYDDTHDNLVELIVPAISVALSLAQRGAVFCAGSKLKFMPEAAAVGGIYTPAGTGRNAWGFTNFHAIALYGHCPHLKFGAGNTVLRSSESAEASDHPVPKPIGWMTWLVALASVIDDTVLDPFMGSGTTGVACVKLGRKFIGIEIEEKYFSIACKRIEAATREPRLPLPEPRPKPALFPGM